MALRKFINEDKAVSPIIGTILMVAITVIMAAIIASWSAGIRAPQTPATVGLDVARLTQYNVTITITSIDPPQTVVDHLSITFNSSGASPPSMVKRVLLGKGAPNATGYTNDTSAGSVSDVRTNYVEANASLAITAAKAGDMATIWISDYSQFLVITATFGDGTVKALYSQKV